MVLKRADFELKRRRSPKQPLLRELINKIISEREGFLSQSVALASLFVRSFSPQEEGREAEEKDKKILRFQHASWPMR